MLNSPYVERVIASFRESLVWLFQEEVQDTGFSLEMDQQISLMVYDFLCNRIGLRYIVNHDPEQMGHDLCMVVFGTGIRFIDRESYSHALATCLDSQAPDWSFKHPITGDDGLIYLE